MIMNPDEKKLNENNDANNRNENINMPGTEQVARNPNPMANENIRVRTEPPHTAPNDEGVGSEITDGEDG